MVLIGFRVYGLGVPVMNIRFVGFSHGDVKGRSEARVRHEVLKIYHPHIDYMGGGTGQMPLVLK